MDLEVLTVAEFIRRAETEELLDRVTVFRELMEPWAVERMVRELVRRGETPEGIAEHDRRRRETALLGSDGIAVQCERCARPAVSRRWRWSWTWLLGGVPVPSVPRWVRLCAEHGGTPRAGG